MCPSSGIVGICVGVAVGLGEGAKVGRFVGARVGAIVGGALTLQLREVIFCGPVIMVSVLVSQHVPAGSAVGELKTHEVAATASAASIGLSPRRRRSSLSG